MLVLYLMCIAGGLLEAGIATAPASPWANVLHFAIQLQKTKPDALAACRFQMLIIDPWRETPTSVSRYTAAEINTIRGARPSKLMVGYLSVGEAASYRDYWQKGWTLHPPAWMGPEDPDWKGSFKVSFWEPAWEKLLEKDLDAIIDAGFDGAMLDVVDAGEFWADKQRGGARRPAAEREMAELAIRLAEHARKRKPGFGILPNGGLSLLKFPDYLTTIDALVREDVWYNQNRANKPNETADVLKLIAPVLAAGKPAFIIDYVNKPQLVDDFYAKAVAAGIVPYASVRNLDRLVVNPKHDP